MCGVDVRGVFYAAVLGGALLAALAGSMAALYYGNISFGSGMVYGLKVLFVTAVGRLSRPGARRSRGGLLRHSGIAVVRLFPHRMARRLDVRLPGGAARAHAEPVRQTRTPVANMTMTAPLIVLIDAMASSLHTLNRQALKKRGNVAALQGSSGGTMGAALAVTRVIDELNRRIGIIAIYLVLFASLVSAFNAMFRYSTSGMLWLERLFGGGVFGGVVRFYSNNSNTLSEAQWYMFAGMVMLGGAWTLKVNEHVRVDLIYGSVSERTRTWIDLLGGIFFLLPMCTLMIYFTWPWFWQSWITNEGSLERRRPVRWPVKLIVAPRLRPARTSGHLRDHQMRAGADARLRA